MQEIDKLLTAGSGKGELVAKDVCRNKILGDPSEGSLDFTIRFIENLGGRDDSN